MKTRPDVRRLWTLGAISVLALAAPAVAQTRAPLENGGIVDGQHHEPNPAQVLPRERQDGVAPSSGQAEHNAATIDQLDQHLLNQERTNPPTQSSVPPIQDAQPGGPR